jgi:hypothetical protein
MMKEEALRKPLFIHAQDWYIPAVCVDCPEFNFIPLPEGAVAFCRRIEEDLNCLFHPVDKDRDEKNEFSTTPLLNLESLKPIEAL